MKRILSICLLLVILTGCGNASQLDRGLALRQKLLASDGCQFDCEILSDHIDKLYQFSLQCTGDKEGTLSFTVLAPESISGITGTVAQEKGALTFDEEVLVFPLLAEGEITPVSAPWLMLRALRSGYLAASGTDGELLLLNIDDSYGERPMEINVWVNDQDQPEKCEILWKGRRVVSLRVSNFRYL